VATEPPQTSLPQADDAELEALMKEIEEAPESTADKNRLGFAGVVVEAAPMTAAEIAAQAREEQSAQRGRREEELEADKEEAAQQLQDEFDEMEGLEERVRRLREQREALRKAHVQAETTNVVLADPESVGYESDESESVDEEWDDWSFRPA
jgi:DNA repair exonuclease SbcCD ATPase subunit